MFHKRIHFLQRNLNFLLRKRELKITAALTKYPHVKSEINTSEWHTNRELAESQIHKNHNYFLQEYDFTKIKLDTHWEQFKNDLLNHSRDVNQQNVNAIIVNYLTYNRMMDQARKFVSYLRKKDEELNVGAMGKILKLYYNIAKVEKLSKAEIEHIFEIYQNLNSKYPVLDIETNSNLICGLSCTPKWEDCIEILSKMKKIGLPTSTIYSSIVSAAFSNEKPDVGWNIVNEMTNDKRIPSDQVYLSWFNYCVKKFKTANKLLPELEKSLIYLADNELKIGQSPSKELLKIFQDRLGWSGSVTSILPNGKCPHCKGSLDSVEVSHEEYQLLRDEFFTKVMVGRNIFIKSTPKEIEHFKTFLNETSPYDIVIDGLNVSFSRGPRSVSKCSEHLVLVVKKLLETHKKILVLGRMHMTNWTKHDINFLKKHTYLFFTDDLSYDDPFLLYAALCSPDTYFISRDLMRGHKFLLRDDKLKSIFKKWQQSRQYMIDRITRTGKVIINEPLQWSITAHKNTGWHIPINETGFLLQSDVLEVPNSWLCLYPPSKPKRVYKKAKE